MLGSNLACYSRTLLTGAARSTSRALAVRHIIRMPIRYPQPPLYRGIYKTDGDECLRDDIILVQRKWDYFPGLNVRADVTEKQLKILRADCDGVVLISREKCNLDFDNPHLEERYKQRAEEGMEIHKLHFNVVPHEMEGKFRLVNER